MALCVPSGDNALFFAIWVIGLKNEIRKQRVKCKMARSVLDARGVGRAEKELQRLRNGMKMRSAKLLELSNLNPRAPSWLPRELRKPQMVRFEGVECAQQ